MISLNEYIVKFNDELFSDFKNIERYTTHKDMDSILYKDGLLNDIGNFIKPLSKEDFNHVMFEFFQPNATFLSTEISSLDESKKTVMKSIMERLYKNDFHDRFGIWLNYESQWNFINKDSKTLLDNLVFNYTRDDYFSNKMDQKLDFIVFHNRLKEIKNQSKTAAENINELLFSNGDDIDGLGNLLKRVIKDKFMESLGLDEQSRYAIDNILFVGPIKNSKNYGNISQDTFQDEYCSLDDDKLNAGMNLLAEKAMPIEMMNKLNSALSFIDALTVLAKKNYNVTSNIFNSSVKNVHKNILDAATEASKRNNRQERYMLVHNACYSIFNELFYLKKDEKPKEERTIDNPSPETPKTVFLFHNNKETVDDNNNKTNDVWVFCHLFFNLHMMNCYKSQVKNAISFMDSPLNTKVDSITDEHVSIARLKYLIQDYFVIIQQYNDKQYPDKKDIQDFWEKRVNSFGIVIADTKENKPRDVPDSEYGKSKVNRQRSDNMWEADTDYVLKKNTPMALYYEYMTAVFMEFRHPKIPFFQSLMMTIRHLIPPPNVLLDNFLNQIKGRQSSAAPKNPNNYDFSFNYNPYYDGLGGAVDRFESLEESAKKMSSTIDVGPQGDKILVASSETNKQVGAKTANTQTELSEAQGMADATSKEQGGADAPAPAPAPAPKPLVCGPNEKKVRKNRGPGGASQGDKCVPKTGADVRRAEENKRKEEERKTHEKNRCGPNEVASYQTLRSGQQQLRCKARPCPPGQEQKLVKGGFRGSKKLKCVPV